MKNKTALLHVVFLLLNFATTNAQHAVAPKMVLIEGTDGKD